MKLLRTALIGLIGILAFPGTVACTIVFIFASVIIQLIYKLTKAEWSDILEIMLEDYTEFGRAIYRFIQTGKFVIES